MGEVLNVDWAVFLNNNDEIRVNLDRMATDLNDGLANYSSLKSMVESINTELSKLVNVTAPRLNELDGILNKMNTSYDTFLDKLTNTLMCLKYYEIEIKKYNEGTSSSIASFSEFMNGDSDLVSQLMNDVRSEMNYEAINFALDVEALKIRQDGNGYIGSVGSPLWKAFKNYGAIVFDEVPLIWQNITTGTALGFICSAGFSAFFDLAVEGRGEIDWEELGFNATRGAVVSASWMGIAGAIGGVPGVAVATVVAIPLSLGMNWLYGEFNNTNPIDSFTIDGVQYEVPGNGLGRNGRYDLLLSKFDRVYNAPFETNGIDVSRHNYYNSLTFLDYVLDDSSQFFDGNFMKDLNFYSGMNYQTSIDYRTLTRFNNVLERALRFSTVDEAWDFFHSNLNSSFDTNVLFNYLIDNYGFEFDRYYEEKRASNESYSVIDNKVENSDFIKYISSDSYDEFMYELNLYCGSVSSGNSIYLNDDTISRFNDILKSALSQSDSQNAEDRFFYELDNLDPSYGVTILHIYNYLESAYGFDIKEYYYYVNGRH